MPLPVNRVDTVRVPNDTTTYNIVPSSLQDGSGKHSIATPTTTKDMTLVVGVKINNVTKEPTNGIVDLGTFQDGLDGDQLAAVNSGITADKVTKYEGYETKINSNTSEITTIKETLKSGVTFKGTVTGDELPPTTDYNNGDLIIFGKKEYICFDKGTSKEWIELGDEGTHLTKTMADTYYVPYSGATKDVNLGEHSATVKNIVANGTTKLGGGFEPIKSYTVNADYRGTQTTLVLNVFTENYVESSKMYSFFGSASATALGVGEFICNGSYRLDTNGNLDGAVLLTTMKQDIGSLIMACQYENGQLIAVSLAGYDDIESVQTWANGTFAQLGNPNNFTGSSNVFNGSLITNGTLQLNGGFEPLKTYTMGGRYGEKTTTATLSVFSEKSMVFPSTTATRYTFQGSINTPILGGDMIGEGLYILDANNDVEVLVLVNGINVFSYSSETFKIDTLEQKADIEMYVERYVEGALTEIKGDIPNNIKDGTGNGSLNQIKDGTGTTFSIDDSSGNSKNPNAYALDNTIKGDIVFGGVGQYSTSLGGKSSAQGKRSVAQGTTTIAKGNYSHAEGDNSVALGPDSHAEGYATTTSGDASHSEGDNTVAQGNKSHAEGLSTKAIGEASHSEGKETSAESYASHTEGYKTRTTKEYAHAEGENTLASGQAAHAEGVYTVASGNASMAVGSYTKALGYGSFACGAATQAIGEYSFAQGYQTKASSPRQAVFGTLNSDDENALLIVGNGDGNGRKNVFTVNKDGTTTISKDPVNDFDVATKGYVDRGIGVKQDVIYGAQAQALNSTITKAKVDKYEGYETKINSNTTEITTIKETLKSGVTFKGKITDPTLPAATDYNNGDLIIFGEKEYICFDNGTSKEWIELGDEGTHLTKAMADTYYVKKLGTGTDYRVYMVSPNGTDTSRIVSSSVVNGAVPLRTSAGQLALPDQSTSAPAANNAISQSYADGRYQYQMDRKTTDFHSVTTFRWLNDSNQREMVINGSWVGFYSGGHQLLILRGDTFTYLDKVVKWSDLADLVEKETVLLNGDTGSIGSYTSVGNGVSSALNFAGQNISNTAKGVNSLSLGRLNSVEGAACFAYGNKNIIKGVASIAFGGGNTAGEKIDWTSLDAATNSSSSYCFAIGENNTSIGRTSITIGTANNSKGDGSISIGRDNTIWSKESVAIGRNNYLNRVSTGSYEENEPDQGNGIVAIGTGLKTPLRYRDVDYSNNFYWNCVISGRYNDPYAYNCVRSSDLVYTSSLPPLFTLGNGLSDTNRNNAIVLFHNASSINSDFIYFNEYSIFNKKCEFRGSETIIEGTLKDASGAQYIKGGTITTSFINSLF